MAMDSQLNWIYTEFLNVYRDYILYLQQIGVLLVSSVSIILFNHIKEKKPIFWILIGFAFFFGVISLIIGLFIYSNTLGLILDYSAKTPDLTSLKYFIYVQFFLELITLSLLISTVAYFKWRDK